MSLRPLIYSVRDLSPLQAALGSQDPSWVEFILKAAQGKEREATPEFLEYVRNLAQAFVVGEAKPNGEPGSWWLVIQLLAEALDLLVYESPVSSDWRWDAWFDYRRETAGVISGEGARLLNYLVDGRGLRSASVVGQGCYYAWLNSAEVESLVSELLEAEEGNPEIVELCEGFHEELLDSVAACRGHSLLLLAH